MSLLSCKTGSTSQLVKLNGFIRVKICIIKLRAVLKLDFMKQILLLLAVTKFQLEAEKVSGHVFGLVFWLLLVKQL